MLNLNICYLLKILIIESFAFSPNDSGPIYTETMRGLQPIIEPWNTGSNLIFLAVFLYWSRRSYNPESRNYFIARALPLLFLGWVGGSLYHGTRSHNLWFFMDFVPIAILAMALAAHAWNRVLHSVFKTIAALAIVYAISQLAVIALPNAVASEAFKSYLSLALNASLPLFLYSRSEGWRERSWMLLGLFFFASALSLRQLDASIGWLLPMGSHFLWHLLGGISTHCLCQFIDRNDRLADLRANGEINEKDNSLAAAAVRKNKFAG